MLSRISSVALRAVRTPTVWTAARALSATASELDSKMAVLAAEYLPLAREFLSEAIRIPSDYVDKDECTREDELPTHGTDNECGLSNHEGPRLEYLKEMLVKHRCVDKPEDAFFDKFGNLVWTVEDETDGIKPEDKRVVYFDGHSDTVRALRSQWQETLGSGIDAYDGLIDADKVDLDAIKEELGWMLPKEEWDQAVWGRGAADQLAGVISQMVSTKIMLDLKAEGALKGVIVRSYATVQEEDNDGGACMYIVRKELPGAPAERIPDAVIFTEGTGDAKLGSLGIYRGQRGRMQIEVDVMGRSCHGSMPSEGLNPVEYGAAIIVEAREQADKGETFLDDPFLSAGTRTLSWGEIDSPSDCAVPSKFTFRFDRRITAGEAPKDAVAAIANLPAVAKAREAGLKVDVRVPVYRGTTHVGYVPDNDQIYIGWLTPEEHPAIQTAVDTYKRVVTPYIRSDLVEEGGRIRREPRVSRWIFSTDGVGWPIPKDDKTINVPASKQWVEDPAQKYPAMFGIGAGLEHHCHKLGEHIDGRDLQHAIAFMSRFPSLYYESS
jgi:putative selenium metabolism hydrolase